MRSEPGASLNPEPNTPGHGHSWDTAEVSSLPKSREEQPGPPQPCRAPASQGTTNVNNSEAFQEGRDQNPKLLIPEILRREAYSRALRWPESEHRMATQRREKGMARPGR